MSLIKSYGVSKNRKIYGNCQILSPEGILMFRCDEKRLNWYLKRNLAEVVSTNPLTAKLKFKPKGLGNHNKPFGLTEMNNICVVCGTQNFLTRHHVVPACYRKNFPLKIKSHNFHDVLSVCVNCHESYERKADQLKKELSILYNAPINGELQTNSDLVKFSKIAYTLLSSQISNIPKSRVEFLKNKIKVKFGIKRLTKSSLFKISKLKLVTSRTHGKMVMDKVEDIQQFVEIWREHFVDNNDCKFLPKNWNIKTKIQNE